MKKAIIILASLAMMFTICLILSNDKSVKAYEVHGKKVVDVKYESPEPFEVEENFFGHWSEDDQGQEYFCYDFPAPETGTKLILTYQDGSKETYTHRYGPDGEYPLFYNDNDELLGEDEWDNILYFSDYSQWTNHWKVNNEYYYTIETIFDIDIKIKVKVVPSNISGVTYKPKNSINILEKCRGDYLTDGSGNKYFHYFAYSETWNDENDYGMPYNLNKYFEKEGDQLTINYKNGSSKTYTYRSLDDPDEMNWYDDSGALLPYCERINVTDNQCENHFKVGTNYVNVNYYGLSTSVPITIVANNISNISFYSADKYDNYDASPYWDEVRYNLFAEGDKLIVSYNNGKQEIFTRKYIEQRRNGAGSTISEEWINQDGDLIEYPLYTQSDQWRDPWTLNGNNSFSIMYMGQQYTVPVNLKTENVKTVRLISDSKLVHYYSEWNESDDGEYYLNFGDFSNRNGAQIEITYDDGTSKTYTYKSVCINKDKDVYDEGFFDDDGNKLFNAHNRIKISIKDNNGKIKSGENDITLSYLGATFDFKIDVIGGNGGGTSEDQTQPVEENKEKSTSNTIDTIVKAIVENSVTIDKPIVKKKSSKKLTVKVEKVKGASGYEVAVYKNKKTAKKSKKAIVKKKSKTSKITLKSKKIKNKKLLFVRARAYVVKNNKNMYGKWSKIKKVKIK